MLEDAGCSCKRVITLKELMGWSFLLKKGSQSWVDSALFNIFLYGVRRLAWSSIFLLQNHDIDWRSSGCEVEKCAGVYLMFLYSISCRIATSPWCLLHIVSQLERQLNAIFNKEEEERIRKEEAERDDGWRTYGSSFTPL